MNNNFVEKIDNSSIEMRKKILELTYNTGRTGAHIGGALSLVEIMCVLYNGVLQYNPMNMYDEKRDRVILSKGHGVLAWYVALNHVGIIEDSILKTFKKNGSLLSAHPSMNPQYGIEFSSGSLGQGLSLGVGCSLALKRKKNKIARVFVILGDGECNEGSVWEAAWSASHFKCDNLIAIVDRNKLQYDGLTNVVLGDDCFEEKWRSFGWDVLCVNGHDAEDIYNALTKKQTKPMVVIAETIKGKGISFMENNPLWHNHSLSKEQYEQALEELGGEIVD